MRLIGLVCECAQVGEYFRIIMHHAVLLTKGVIETHELGIARAGVFIGKTEGADVLLLHAGKQPVELREEVFAVSFAERYSHAEVYDAFYLCFGAVSENAEKVFEEGYDIDSLITKYPASPAAAFYLYRYFTYQLPLDELKATRAKISSELAGCPYVKDLDGIIKQLENVQIGKVAPEFSLPDTAGVSVSLSDFRGKYVLLDFWASWCPPCRRENPNVVKAFNEYKDKNFTIVGISLDKDKSKWMKAIADDNLAWTHLSDLKYWDSEIPALYGVRGIPANVLLDPDGVIVAKNITGEDLHKKLKEVIK